MKPLRLNRRLVLEEAARLPDGAGGYATVWEARGILWAAVEAGSGRERAGEFVTVSTVTYRITVRAAPIGSPRRPRPEQRLRDGARVFRIAAVAEDDPDGHYLTCFAQEELLA
ncbi:head-tail adaptor protein [Albidovulum sediminicola]|uniref:Head-tail adaptor protein n=1 Tax=Albidovulum sediminicola TaxID=2984331 RepID=A0ABT2Z0H8_9RHOB|nr:head-tail adaptor protein [Defluviimonas sp. WL0075]MCV2864629.1 head-tail adaptor protein [Defluviimonas sp. WL0075]